MTAEDVVDRLIERWKIDASEEIRAAEKRGEDRATANWREAVSDLLDQMRYVDGHGNVFYGIPYTAELRKIIALVEKHK